MIGMRCAALAALLVVACPAGAAVYKCVKDGKPVFSDRPCGEDAKEIQVKPAPPGGLTGMARGYIPQLLPTPAASAPAQAVAPRRPSARAADIEAAVRNRRVIVGMSRKDLDRAVDPCCRETFRESQTYFNGETVTERFYEQHQEGWPRYVLIDGGGKVTAAFDQYPGQHWAPVN